MISIANGIEVLKTAGDRSKLVDCSHVLDHVTVM